MTKRPSASSAPARQAAASPSTRLRSSITARRPRRRAAGQTAEDSRPVLPLSPVTSQFSCSPFAVRNQVHSDRGRLSPPEKCPAHSSPHPGPGPQHSDHPRVRVCGEQHHHDNTSSCKISALHLPGDSLQPLITYQVSPVKFQHQSRRSDAKETRGIK